MPGNGNGDLCKEKRHFWSNWQHYIYVYIYIYADTFGWTGLQPKKMPDETVQMKRHEHVVKTINETCKQHVFEHILYIPNSSSIEKDKDIDVVLKGLASTKWTFAYELRSNNPPEGCLSSFVVSSGFIPRYKQPAGFLCPSKLVFQSDPTHTLPSDCMRVLLLYAGVSNYHFCFHVFWWTIYRCWFCCSIMFNSPIFHCHRHW